MGYRHYFMKASKEEIDKIKGITYSKEDEVPWIKELFPQEEIFEFGKLYYEDTAQMIYETGIPLFENPETQEEFSDYVPYVVGKEGLLKAIEIYSNKVVNYYKSLLEDGQTRIVPIFGLEVPEEKPKAEKQEEHIKDMLSEWERGWAVDLNPENEKITSSWKYEYEIFELVRLLKTIDWERDTILFYGW